MTWDPDWMPLAPEPRGDDEAEAVARFVAWEREIGSTSGDTWDDLPEWVREAWRREVRDH